MLNPFEAAAKLLNRRDNQNMKFSEKLNMFFVDFDMVPLIIHENYLSTYGATRSPDDVQKMAESADYISLGDCIDRTVRSEGAWELLPNQGIFSSVAPATISAGSLSMAKFPT